MTEAALERRSLAAAIGTATVMIAHQVAGKATRDALFLSQFDVNVLPRALVVAALLSLLAVLIMSRLLERVAPNRLVSACFALSGVLFVVEWLLFDSQPRVAAVLLYLHMAVFGAILISGFWSVLSERFDPHTAKRRVAQVTAATALGGVFGGLMAERVGSFAGVDATLPVLALMHGLCAVGVRHIGVVTSPSAPAAPAALTSGLGILARMPYLRSMGALIMLTAISAALLDFTLKAAAQDHYADADGLVGFFAAYYALTGIIGFLVQGMLGPRLLQRYGIGVALAVLPAFTLAAGVFATLFQHFVSVVALRGGQAVLVNSLNRSATELLYMPLTPEQKRPTKTIVDVAAERGGDMVGGGLVLVVLWLMPQGSGVPLVLLAAAAAAVALWHVRRLHDGYVDQLARGLRRGVVTVDSDKVVDATTQHILAETSVYAEREQLMTRIREMRASREERAEDDVPVPPNDDDGDGEPTLRAPFLPIAPVASDKSQRFARAVTDLTAEDPVVVRRALAGEFMDIRLVPYLIPLLGRDEVAADARMELRWQVPRIIGQLTDALLDPDLSLRVRQRLPSVLEVCHNPRAVEALVLGLEDEEFSVRYSAARALARMRARDPSLRVDPAAVYVAVRCEVALEPSEWQARRLLGDTAFDGSSQGPANRTLEHVFTLLSLVHDRDALRLCMQALGSRDGHLRGTALEYLENVLPEDLRPGLWLHLGVREAGRPRRARSRGEVVRELRASADGMQTRQRR